MLSDGHPVPAAPGADSDRYELVTTYPVSQDETWAPPVLLQDGILVKDQQTLRRYSF